MILWLLKECGVNNVPSYNAFRKMQENLKKQCASDPKRHISDAGNVFYINDIRESVAKVRLLISYPEMPAN
jgi:hypothetical protein